jgi:hypothetical protein
MTTTTLAVGKPGWFSQRGAYDWLYALCIVLGAGYAFQRYGSSMDVYERGILLGAVPSLIGLGWFWGPLRTLSLGVGAATLLAISLYNQHLDNFGADLAAGDKVFLLKYFLASQSAIMWMSVLFYMSTLFYWIGFFTRQGGENALGLKVGSGLAWAAVFMALTGTMVRWFESHQIGPDIGHIPVSNLYEVFVLFCWLTTLFYLYYEAHYKIRSLGLRDAGGQRRGGLPALVHPGARCPGDPAAGAGPAELVDEAARAGQLHRLRHLRAGRHGRPGLPAQGVGPRSLWTAWWRCPACSPWASPAMPPWPARRTPRWTPPGRPCA